MSFPVISVSSSSQLFCVGPPFSLDKPANPSSPSLSTLLHHLLSSGETYVLSPLFLFFIDFFIDFFYNY